MQFCWAFIFADIPCHSIFHFLAYSWYWLFDIDALALHSMRFSRFYVVLMVNRVKVVRWASRFGHWRAAALPSLYLVCFVLHTRHDKDLCKLTKTNGVNVWRRMIVLNITTYDLVYSRGSQRLPCGGMILPQICLGWPTDPKVRADTFPRRAERLYKCLGCDCCRHGIGVRLVGSECSFRGDRHMWHQTKVSAYIWWRISKE